MKRLILPLVMFHIVNDLGERFGLGIADFTENESDCADQAADCDAAGEPWRAFRLEFCPDTNRLIHCEEVTSDIAAILAMPRVLEAAE